MASIGLIVDGRTVEVPNNAGSLLDALRDHLDVRSVKDGCSPQGQCGCCTVLVDGAPRVACVTPVRRVAGRAITTVDGLPDEARDHWASAFAGHGGSQCGFCTPGIVLRLEGLRQADRLEVAKVEQAMLAHLCRCTGWQTIVESAVAAPTSTSSRDLAAASQRAAIEGHTSQRVDPLIALGHGGFADDTAPSGALVAVPDGAGGWAVGETLAEARTRAGKIQGRRTTVASEPPIPVPSGDWAITLQTSWVEPGYLETDAAWCEPGGEPATALANGGAFGGKSDSAIGEVARQLASEHGRAVRVRFGREDTVRLGPKRPPLAAGIRPDGSGVVHVARTPGIGEIIQAVAPGMEVVEVDVAGPPTSTAIRAAGWAEMVCLRAAARGAVGEVVSPAGGRATASIDGDGTVHVTVDAGRVLDEVTLRSYAIGAAHMALSLVSSESLSVDTGGEVHDLTIRSFGILRAVDMPSVGVTITASDREPVNGSDAVFAAVAAATWLHQGSPGVWPTGIAVRS